MKYFKAFRSMYETYRSTISELKKSERPLDWSTSRQKTACSPLFSDCYSPDMIVLTKCLSESLDKQCLLNCKEQSSNMVCKPEKRLL